MKRVWMVVASFGLVAALSGCGTSKDQPESVSAPQTLDLGGEARFKADGASLPKSKYVCDWSKGVKHVADSRLRAGMRFVTKGQTVGNSGASQGSVETTVVSVEPQRLVAETKILEASGKTHGLSAGQSFRMDCGVRSTSAGAERVECSMTPEPAGLTPGENCYVRSEGRAGDSDQSEFIPGQFVLASGVTVPAELERTTVKGVRICSGVSGNEENRGRAQEVRVTIRTRSIPSRELEPCDRGAAVYGYREIRDESGAVLDGDLDEVIEAPVLNN